MFVVYENILHIFIKNIRKIKVKNKNLFIVREN